MKDLVLPDIEAYAEAHSWSESPVCRALREDTYRNMEFPQHGRGAARRRVFENDDAGRSSQAGAGNRNVHRL